MLNLIVGNNILVTIIFTILCSMSAQAWTIENLNSLRINKKIYIWAWKGNYINLGTGAELGIYYGGGPHWKVDKNLAMDMSMELKYRATTIISYRKKTWWITGFNPAKKYLNAQASDLKVKFTATFNKTRMFKDFINRNGIWSRNTVTNTVSYTF